MKIDLTAPLMENLKKTYNEFLDCKTKGDMAGAYRKAVEIANLYVGLADMGDFTREENLKKARMWQEAAKGIISKSNSLNTHHGVHNSANSSEIGDITDPDCSQQNSKIESLITKSKVKWSDIGGLSHVKELLMETVVIAGSKKPEVIKPWKGVLLFGPPGTGKTLLASAAAGSLDATFFNVKSEGILSKYFGESSKLIASLYNSARTHAPSIVYLDEFDALTRSRGGEDSEASRNVLSSLLTELDGLSDKKSDMLLLTLAATNTPWDMDSAILSRFPRRIYVPLPDVDACESILKIQMSGLDVSGIDLKSIAAQCAEKLYSGRDLSGFSQFAIWTMIRDVNPDLHKLAELPYEELKVRNLKTRALKQSDFDEAFKKIHSPMTKEIITKYEEWMKLYGEIMA